jgi:hypothetical protein
MHGAELTVNGRSFDRRTRTRGDAELGESPSQAPASAFDCAPDLRRALTVVEETEWSSALELARAYQAVQAFVAGLRLQAVQAFVAGLRLLPEGEDLTCRLGLGEVRSLQHEIRREDDVIVEELRALLCANVGASPRVHVTSRPRTKSNSASDHHLHVPLWHVVDFISLPLVHSSPLELTSSVLHRFSHSGWLPAFVH